MWIRFIAERLAILSCFNRREAATPQLAAAPRQRESQLHLRPRLQPHLARRVG